MRSLRHHILRNRWLALWLAGLALLMRIVVPAGYMPMASSGSLSIELCPGSGPTMPAMAMPGGGADRHDGKSQHGGGAAPCDFSSLTAPSLGGADPVLLAIAIAFIIAAAFLPATLRPVTRRTYLRPPLRGPPAAT